MWKLNKLFCEKDKEMSIGRMLTWLAFIPALHIWWNGEDVKPHHLYVLGFLLLYNFSKKLTTIIGPAIDLIKAYRGTA